MPTCQLTISIEEGLHARPAAKFVKLANKFPCEIWVEKDDEEINGKSIMGVMMLAASKGTNLTLSADGSDEETALSALESLIGNRFEEPE